jgi:hypothetical protein
VGFESFTQVPMFHFVPTLFNALARAALVLCAVFIGTLTGRSAEAESKNAPVVAAAASIQFALGEIIDSFYSKTGVRVRLSLGSSGNLSRQIRQGAPYQLFLSADERYVQELTRDGLTEGNGMIYSLGRIAIIVPHGSPLTADGALVSRVFGKESALIWCSEKTSLRRHSSPLRQTPRAASSLTHWRYRPRSPSSARPH